MQKRGDCGYVKVMPIFTAGKYMIANMIVASARHISAAVSRTSTAIHTHGSASVSRYMSAINIYADGVLSMGRSPMIGCQCITLNH